MDHFKDQKEMKMAMNGRIGLMTGGIILVFTAITTTMMYGINLFGLASGAANGNAEYAELLESANMSVGLLRIIAGCFLIMAVLEIFVGFFSARLSNRLDKVDKTKKLIIALLALEIVLQVFLLITRMMNFGMLFTSLVIPLYMLWSATRLCKIAKEYPDRIYALNTKKPAAQKRGQAPAKPAPSKSLRERAMMTAQESEESPDPEEETPDPEEETPDPEEETPDPEAASEPEEL